MDKLKVMVVDDSVVYRKIITAAAEMTGKGEVDCTASSGITALERLEQRLVDVVLLDVFMEGLDGIQTLKRIKELYPQISVIMISGGGEDSAQITVKALEMGAMDFIIKPSSGKPELNIQIISQRLKILFSEILIDKYTMKSRTVKVDNGMIKKQPSRSNLPSYVYRKKKIRTSAFGGVDIVVIASSTGGPTALENVCTNFNETLNKPIVVVQHMPSEFTDIFAKSLNRKCLLPVKEAKDGEKLVKGTVYIAPGGFHLTVVNDRKDKRTRVFRLESTAIVNGVRPSADVLFNSIASSYKGQRVLAVILTGMGNDGTKGVAALKKACQCYCITQSKETSIIYGMPRSVYDAGLSDEVVDLNKIGLRIMEIAGTNKQK